MLLTRFDCIYYRPILAFIYLLTIRPTVIPHLKRQATLISKVLRDALHSTLHDNYDTAQSDNLRNLILLIGYSYCEF